MESRYILGRQKHYMHIPGHIENYVQLIDAHLIVALHSNDEHCSLGGLMNPFKHLLNVEKNYTYLYSKGLHMELQMMRYIVKYCLGRNSDTFK